MHIFAYFRWFYSKNELKTHVKNRNGKFFCSQQNFITNKFFLLKFLFFCLNLVQVFTVLVFHVDVLEFLSAYFSVFSAYFDSLKCIFACIFYTF